MDQKLVPSYIKNISEMLDDGMILTDKHGLVLLSNISA